ncbi:hypothetical protein CY34DRAFT_742854 [Suillus luteus UH-Slu-Lm8-n1]|uniref:Uncharacterized protein n=1 Tax=Suillus luteus UH-Slu-Lm8-n1 TaxID=930992 RepID=A0A0D0A418_9AGAM|nr:hypothetical protein CY34DRAFT_742854 [Suillus luteus UH-Slu-Lm8-n1]
MMACLHQHRHGVTRDLTKFVSISLIRQYQISEVLVMAGLVKPLHFGSGVLDEIHICGLYTSKTHNLLRITLIPQSSCTVTIGTDFHRPTCKCRVQRLGIARVSLALSNSICAVRTDWDAICTWPTVSRVLYGIGTTFGR